MKVFLLLTIFICCFLKISTAQKNNDQVIAIKGNDTQTVKNSRFPPGIYTNVEQMPEFHGSVNTYIRNHLKYPEEAIEKKIEGKVALRFLIDETGIVNNVEIVKSVDVFLDAEALRMVTNMPKWKPAMSNGTAIPVSYTLPILFKL